MSKITIPKPELELYTTVYRVTVNDLNYGNHLGNDRLLSIAQEVRMRWLKTQGRSEIDFFGSSLIQADAVISYRSEGFYADEIEVVLGVANSSNSSFDFVYDLFNNTTNKTLAAMKTRMVCFNYDIRKVETLPAEFIELCESMKN